MKTISILFKSMLMLPSVRESNMHLYVITGMMLYLVMITLVLAFFKINKSEAGNEK